jgi:hypothetical protein
VIDLPKAIRDLLTPPPPIHSPFTGGGTSLTDWWNFFLSLLAFIFWAAELVVKIVTLPVKLLAELGTAPVRFLLWVTQKAIYEIYEKTRLALSLAGYIHPEPIHLGYFAEAVTPPHASFLRLGGPFTETIKPPEQVYHLLHPHKLPAKLEVAIETPGTDVYTSYFPGRPLFGVSAADPAPFYDVESPLVGELDGNYIPPAFHQLPTAKLPSAIRSLIAGNQANAFASARSVGVYVIEQFLKDGGANVPNWNLDGDRGYGWPSWETKPKSAKPWSDTSFNFTS